MRTGTHFSILRTISVLPHFSVSLARYSRDARSRESTTPSEADAFDFQSLVGRGNQVSS